MEANSSQEPEWLLIMHVLSVRRGTTPNTLCAAFAWEEYAHSCRMINKPWLAMEGEWSWDDVPYFSPELIFLPHWAPVSIYLFSYWARSILVPLLVISSPRLTAPVASFMTSPRGMQFLCLLQRVPPWRTDSSATSTK